VEVQTMESNIPAINLYQKLGFKPIGEGCVFRKG